MISLQKLSIKSINETIKWDGVDRGYENALGKII